MKFKTRVELADFYLGIPEERWTCKVFQNATGQACAIGHVLGADPNWRAEQGLQEMAGIDNMPAVNDGHTGMLVNSAKYQDLGDTPKERIINALVLAEAGLWEEANGSN